MAINSTKEEQTLIIVMNSAAMWETHKANSVINQLL